MNRADRIRKMVMERRELSEASAANWNRTTPKHIQRLKGLVHKAWNWITGSKDTRTHKDETGQEYKMKKGHIETDKPLSGPLIIKKGDASSKNNKKSKGLDHVPDLSDQKYEVAQQKHVARERMRELKAAAHDKIAQKMAKDDSARKRIEGTKALRAKKKEATAPTSTETSHHEKAKATLKATIEKKRRSKKTARKTRTKKLAAVAEEAPVNNVGGGQVAGLGVGPQGEPGRRKSLLPMLRRRKPSFAGAAVFEVDSATFCNIKNAKRKHGHWRTYLEEDDALKEVREYAAMFPHKPIVIQNGMTGEMTYARYGKKR